ncbi:hypothetical protein F2Q70_00017353 [Brassica cretica]|uniref:Uncharacterized protein n=1 Tax=Brassica cretica TaxID=69181 RepID=A0A8S9HLW8_BRACR|nr:hypothetical protein F2Q70_00017353 [Brassica cretica]
MHGLMSYRRFGRGRSLRSDRAEWMFGLYVETELWLELGCYVATERSTCLVSSAKVFRKEESIPKKYLSKKFSTFFFFGDLDVNFFVTVFDPNKHEDLDSSREVTMEDFLELEEWLEDMNQNSKKKLDDD